MATGQLKVLELILKRGADVEDVDRAGNTVGCGAEFSFRHPKKTIQTRHSTLPLYPLPQAMILAVRERHTEIVALLIDKITNETKRKNLLRSVDKYDNTAMHHAAEGGWLWL